MDCTSSQSLEETLKLADQDPVIHALRVWGPSELLKLVTDYVDEKGYKLTPPVTPDMCSICKYLFTDHARTQLVEQALDDGAIRRELAFDRMARLGEVSMFLNYSDEETVDQDAT
jgi:hypothetical protein